MLNKLHASTFDELYTPQDAMPALVNNLPSWVEKVWCPCDTGSSEIFKTLDVAGKEVVATHILGGYDFLKYTPEFKYDMIITNPPYSNKDDFIARCVELGKPWALLLPLDSLCGKRRYELYKSGVGVITLAKPFRHKTLEERAAEFDGKLMLDGEYDWGEPVGREVW